MLALDISPDKDLLCIGRAGPFVKIFRTADGELAATLRKHTDWILSLAFSPEGLLLASGDRFGGAAGLGSRIGEGVSYVARSRRTGHLPGLDS